MHHSYISNLQSDNNINKNYKSYILQDTRKLVQNNLPIILTINHLCELAKVNYRDIYSLVFRKYISDDNYEDGYKIFPIKKRNSEEKRWISVPNSTLLKVQKFINQNILYSEFSVRLLQNCCTAYLPNKGQKYNASFHISNDNLIKIDIRHFFESISERQVYKVFKTFGYSDYISFVFARLCTRITNNFRDRLPNKRHLRNQRWYTSKLYKNNPQNYISTKDRGDNWVKEIINSPKIPLGSLPQGAPSSPMLANLVARDMDDKLLEISYNHELTYTRYADDLVFSGSTMNPKPIISQVYRVLSNHGFKPNHNKTTFVKKGKRKIVTGVCINDKVMHVPRNYKDKIRQELYYIGKLGLEDHCRNIGYQNIVTYVLRLEGKINYVKSIEPKKGELFLQELTKLIPNIEFYKSI